VSTSKRAVAALAMFAAILGIGMGIATPASAHSTQAPAPVSDSVATEYGMQSAVPMVWYIYNFYPNESTCEAQRWWGTSQGWWTWDDSACATNGRDWALFIQYDGLVRS
jgi:hypothetical protein